MNFLKLIRFTIMARELDFERVVPKVAEGQMGKVGVADILRQNRRRHR